MAQTRLIIAPALVQTTSDRGATIEFMGGRLWVRPDVASRLQTKEYQAVELLVKIRNVSLGDKRYDAVFVQDLGAAK